MELMNIMKKKFLEEIIESYKKGPSKERLSIISNVVTIISAVFTLIAGQLFTLKYIFESTVVIKICFYVFTMGISLGIYYVFIYFIKEINKIINVLLLKIAIWLLTVPVFLLILYTIWGFILQIQ